MTSFFGSIQSTLTRIMDPNEYDSLLATLVASFNNVNSEIILAAVLVLAGIVFVLRKELCAFGRVVSWKTSGNQSGCGL